MGLVAVADMSVSFRIARRELSKRGGFGRSKHGRHRLSAAKTLRSSETSVAIFSYFRHTTVRLIRIVGLCGLSLC
jgi:hypothetical protein